MISSSNLLCFATSSLWMLWISLIRYSNLSLKATSSLNAKSAYLKSSSNWVFSIKSISRYWERWFTSEINLTCLSFSLSSKAFNYFSFSWRSNSIFSTWARFSFSSSFTVDLKSPREQYSRRMPKTFQSWAIKVFRSDEWERISRSI